MQKISQSREFPFLTENKKTDNLIEDVQNNIVEVLEEPELQEELQEEPQEVLQTIDEEPIEKEVVINEPEPISFKLNFVPGADDQEEIVEEEPEEMVVEEKPNSFDPWNWESRGLENFLDWVKERIENIPKHSGKDTTGIERAIAYLKRLDGEISKAMRKDHDRKIDAEKAEEARLELADGMDRLEERLERLVSRKFKKSKKALQESKLVKQAEIPAGSGKLVVSVPYLISNIARACINGAVSSGKDMEEIFKTMSKEYKLDNREKLQIAQLIRDMGYPLILDRPVLNKSDLKPSENIDGELSLQYYS